ncbi:phosphotriesterase [Mycolicibacterium sp. CH28]|uniref:phosphotriesterase family protein n=1 Tax=Mycolicibacterium sp. CH28 TaxID=2512237 RepID=UPI001081008B|nr:phosphotriesterase [Mycolicibacterium sp. CH28]TGD89828.1 phosphotriesterase [Mycolicibacterium sp. CH28]
MTKPSPVAVPSPVETVRGPVAASDLGTVLMHEHVFVLSPEIMANYPQGWGDDAAREAEAVAKLNALKAIGVDTIVDPTVIGLGRYLPRIQRVAAQTDLQIVVATGVYTYNDVPMYFHLTGPGTVLGGPETMTDLFVQDITEGIAGTGVKAAILKCATDEPGMTPGVERVLRAVAQAHRRTGVPITTHTHAPTRRGLEQQRIFAEEGVDLSRVVIGHSGDTTDLGYLEELISAGSYLGMDRFGLDLVLSFDDRVDTVVRMCERGHADKMVLSHDASCYIDWLPEAALPLAAPNWHYLHIHNDVLPALRARGVTDEQITTMLVDNPRTIFARQGSHE